MIYEHSDKQTSIVSTLKADTAAALKEKILVGSSNKFEIFFDQDSESDWDKLRKSPYTKCQGTEDITVYGE